MNNMKYDEDENKFSLKGYVGEIPDVKYPTNSLPYFSASTEETKVRITELVEQTTVTDDTKLVVDDVRFGTRSMDIPSINGVKLVGDKTTEDLNIKTGNNFSISVTDDNNGNVSISWTNDVTE